MGARAPSIITKTIEDPLKQAVANPMSKFLAGETGQGVPRFEGEIMSDFSPGAKTSAQNFMDINPQEYWKENIEAPAISQFQEQLGISREDFAGQLSGSGRFRTEEDSISRFTRDLYTSKAQFETQLPQQQFNMALSMKQEQNKEDVAQYNDWMKSLPQYSPQLEQSLKFLNESTSTGTDVLSYLDPGQKSSMGGIGAMAGFAIAALLAVPTGGMSLAALPAIMGAGAIGGAIGGAAGTALGETGLGKII